MKTSTVVLAISASVSLAQSLLCSLISSSGWYPLLPTKLEESGSWSE